MTSIRPTRRWTRPGCGCISEGAYGENLSGGQPRQREEHLFPGVGRADRPAGAHLRVGKEAAEGADILCTLTPSKTPVLEREWLKPGAM